jgi:hypothetical protein
MMESLLDLIEVFRLGQVVVGVAALQAGLQGDRCERLFLIIRACE